MEGNFGLTRTETEIMDYLWGQDSPVPFRELETYFKGEKQKNWKKQTLNTYLSNLQRSGIVGVDKSGTRNAYYPLHSKEELIHQWTAKLVKTSFGGSISKLVAAFASGEKISEEEAEKIRKLL